MPQDNTDPMDPSRQSLVIVTGPAGAGRSTAINALEDLGHEAIDNLPLSLLTRVVQSPAGSKPLALGIDPRNREYSTSALLACIQDLAQRSPMGFQVFYLDCSEDVLLRRFSETRRRHPMSPGEDALKGVLRERALLEPIRERADILIDTSEMSIHDLRADIARLFGSEGGNGLAVSLHSFSYKRGLPRSADMVFDCRFLQNPHWVESLRALTGREEAVAQYVRQDARYDAFVEQVAALCTSLLPAYKEEGKSHFSVAFGCTGGRHRSVAVTEALAQTLALAGWQVSCRHRELDREPAHSDLNMSGAPTTRANA